MPKFEEIALNSQSGQAGASRASHWNFLVDDQADRLISDYACGWYKDWNETPDGDHTSIEGVLQAAIDGLQVSDPSHTRARRTYRRRTATRGQSPLVI